MANGQKNGGLNGNATLVLTIGGIVLVAGAASAVVAVSPENAVNIIGFATTTVAGLLAFLTASNAGREARLAREFSARADANSAAASSNAKEAKEKATEAAVNSTEAKESAGLAVIKAEEIAVAVDGGMKQLLEASVGQAKAEATIAQINKQEAKDAGVLAASDTQTTTVTTTTIASPAVLVSLAPPVPVQHDIVPAIVGGVTTGVVPPVVTGVAEAVVAALVGTQPPPVAPPAEGAARIPDDLKANKSDAEEAKEQTSG